MRYLLLACSSLLLASCAAQHQLTPQRPPRPDVVSLLDTPTTAGATASTAPYESMPGTLAPPLGFDVHGKTSKQAGAKATRILRRWHRQFQRAAKRTQTTPLTDNNVPQSMPRKCKGCTFIVGDNTTLAGKKAQVAAGDGASATVTGKKSGPAIINTDSSTLNAVAGGGNLAAVQGDGNTTSLTKQDTTKEAPGPLAVFADNATAWLPWVAGGCAVGGIVWFLIRRKTANAIS
jgi:hypothetical protein